MFGSVNALFTGLAFAAVIYGLFVQRHEVKLLTEELQGTKRLAEEQQKLAEIQISAQQKQQFEATFFNLLRVFIDLVEGMDLVRSSDRLRTSGRDVFPIFIMRVKNGHVLAAPDIYGNEIPLPESEQPSSEVLYARFYEKHAPELGHYFRTLFNLFKFVGKSTFDETEKRFYTNLIRAQLSDAEAMLLFLNGLSDKGEKFKPYLERYSVLKNVDRNHELFRRSEKRDTYSDTAFG